MGDLSGKGRGGRRVTRPTPLLEVLKDEFHQIHGQDITDVQTLAALHQRCHALPSPRTALCLSGGGIRSAAFALGIIQWLAARGLLHQFQYMSTVSGGGYAGAWLSAWLKNEPGGYADVHQRLVTHASEQPECPEIGKLRENSQYLTPRSGVTSGDTWTAVAIWLRNMVLNWLVILPAVAAICLLPQLIAALMSGAAQAEPAWWAWVAPVGAIVCYTIMFSYVTASRPFWGLLDFERAAFRWACLLPGFVTAILVAVHLVSLRTASPWLMMGLPLLGIHVTVWFAVLAADLIRGRLRPRVYVADAYRPQMPACVLRFELHLSRACSRKIFVWVSTQDRQAVDTIHYEGMSRRRVVFEPGSTRSVIDVNLKYSDIEGVPIDGDDLRLRIVEAPRAMIGRRRRPAVLALDFAGVVLAAISVSTVSGIMVFVARQTLDVLHGGAATDPGADVSRYASALSKYACLSVPCAILAILVGEFAFVALTSQQPRSDEDREWLARASGAFLRWGLTWLGITATVLAVPIGWAALIPHLHGLDHWVVGSLGALSGLVTAVMGASGKTPALPTEQARWRSSALYAAAAVFLVVLAVSLASAMDVLAGLSDFAGCLGRTGHEDWAVSGRIVLCIVVLSGSALLIGAVVNVNRFSLHAMYRNRLIRTFLGASNPSVGKRNRFTWFNDSDNVEMHRLWDRKALARGKENWRPFHVVNVALNVVATRRLAWQERKAEPFVFTPLWCGAANLDAFRRASEYGGRNKAVTLGTAMAISGAAISPNMGYNSSPVVTLLLTLFNVRLGWWFGNPRDGRSYRLEGPRLALRPLLSEAIGATTDDKPYVYLSDGGHFENLGLYEMVRRRCRLIVVSDAGHDPECAFEDLSNAIRKIAIDFGIPVRFPELREMRKRNQEWRTPDDGGPGFTVGLIDYAVVDGKAVEPGIILYLKPTIRGDEPADVLGYAASNPLFPHDGTGNQWFREAQFESYRSLAVATLERAYKTAGATGSETLQPFLDALREAVMSTSKAVVRRARPRLRTASFDHPKAWQTRRGRHHAPKKG